MKIIIEKIETSMNGYKNTSFVVSHEDKTSAKISFGDMIALVVYMLGPDKDSGIFGLKSEEEHKKSNITWSMPLTEEEVQFMADTQRLFVDSCFNPTHDSITRINPDL